ncbi:S-layer homology domain-containing protein [Paenibacillus sp. PK3_47]|uniref:S-layer homology domain-containing protein n=1 Tax=Paenibacillus sp. PK3_47 TaxID=2072642 RepID=UPI00201DAF23|nr:S-layer homology domain-containing protein [Paenibacillus sp. PK3_47]
MSSIPVPQNSKLINPDYNRTYDNTVVKSEAGFVHPGFYVNREDLNTMRDMVWQGMSPWKESFESFRKSAYSSLSYINSGPFTELTSDRETYALVRDGTAAFNLALMWYITGHEQYSDKAKAILNDWAGTLSSDAKKDVIRNGQAVPQLVMAAEILRYTPSSGWGSPAELEDFEQMLRILLPGVDRKDGYFNQGNFGAQAYMAIAIYLDDLAMYKDAVERTVRNQAMTGLPGESNNFSVDAMILDSGQQVEMGRDIPHAQDSMIPMAVMARTAYLQGTLVNENGQFKTSAEGGTNLFEVHEQKLLKYAAYFSKYNLGEDVIWQPNINGTGDRAPYAKVTTDGRGRIYNSFSALVNYYKYVQGYTDGEERQDPYIGHEDGIYLDLYGDGTYGSLYKYIDAAYESAGMDGIDVMLTTPWYVSIGQSGAGLPSEPQPADNTYELYNRIAGHEYTATGGTEGGVITEPFPDEDGITRFATSNVKNGAWTAYTVDFDRFGSTPDHLADLLMFTYGINSNVGGSIDVRIGDLESTPSEKTFSSAALAGTIHVPNTTWYSIFKTHSQKLTVRPDLLTGQKTVYFYFYGSGNGYNFHADTLWFKFASSSLAALTKAADADVFSSTGAVKNADETVTLSDGGYIGFENMEFDKGYRTFEINAASTGGTLKLNLGSPGGATIKEYALNSTGGIARTFSIEHEEDVPLYGQNSGNNDLYLVYEGDGSITMSHFTGKPAAHTAAFQPVSGGSYAFNVQGQAVREQGTEGAVKLRISPGEDSAVTYTDVDFLNGAPNLRVKVKSDTDAVLHFDMLGNPVGRIAEFHIPRTDGLSPDGWINVSFDLSKTGYNTQSGASNFVRVTASGTGTGTVELQSFLLNEPGEYPVMNASSLDTEILVYPGAKYGNHITASDVYGSRTAVKLTSKPEAAAYDPESGEFIWSIPDQAAEEKGYITFASTGADGVSTSVFMIQYTLLDIESYTAKLIEETILMYPAIEALEEDDYTPEDWNLIVTALNESKAVTGQSSPSREDAEKAYYGLKQALEQVQPIPEADIFGKSANITLNNGNTGDTARSIVSVWFDNKPNTYTEWQGSNQWAVFDFGPGTTFKLNRAKILGRAQWGSRIAGVRVEGSNDAKTWTQLTDTAANTDALQKFFSKDADTEYRYIRIYRPGSWYANLAELKLYGSFTELNLSREISAVSLTSDNGDPMVANAGDTATLAFTADHVIDGVNVVMNGKAVPAVSPDGLNWKAEYPVGEFDLPGAIIFEINYRNGWPVNRTTDGTGVTILEEPGFIEDVMSKADFIDSTPNRSPDATRTQAGYLFDGLTGTNSDFRGPGNNGAGWLVIDFKEGNSLTLSKVKLIARQDLPARAGGTVIQGSADNSSWSNLVSGIQGIQEWQSFSVHDPAGYRYLRISNPSSSWFGNLGELKLYGSLNAESGDQKSPVWPEGSVLDVSGVSASGVTLTWTAAEDDTAVTGYRIYNGIDAEPVTVTGEVYSYSFTGLHPATGYSFKVEAGDSSGNWSADGPAVQVTTLPAADMAAPVWPEGSVLDASGVSASGVTLTWPAAEDDTAVTGYRIYNGVDAEPVTVTGEVYSYSFTGLQAATEYSFKVEAGDSSGNWSTDGPAVQVTTLGGGGTAPTKPPEITPVPQPTPAVTPVPTAGIPAPAATTVPAETPVTTPAPTMAPAATQAPSPQPAVNHFQDIGSKYEWAAEAINRLYAEGIVKGTSGTSFSPEQKITRADFVLLLVRALGLQAESGFNFADVHQGAYYYEALGIAKQLGIVKGVDGNRFNPKEDISRQDMMVMAVRALKSVQQWTGNARAANLSDYPDAAGIAAYAKDSVAELVSEGIVQGDGNAIRPKDTATRAEAAVIIYRIFYGQ